MASGSINQYEYRLYQDWRVSRREESMAQPPLVQGQLATLSLEHALKNTFRAIPESSILHITHKRAPDQSQKAHWTLESLCNPVGEWLRIDLAKQANAYSNAEIDILKRVADIVFSLGCFEFSFPLYVLLLKRSLLPSSPEPVEQRILIACMRSAATEEHILVARQLMEEMLDENTDSEESPLANIPPVLIPLLLAAICFQQDDKEAALQYTTLANGHCLSPYVSMADDGIRFMDAGSKVNKGSSSCKCVAPTDDLLQSHDSPTFPCLIPSPGCSSCCMVRKCLKSCHSLFLTAFAPSP